MKKFFLIFLLSCSQDVSIMKIPNKEDSDTFTSLIDTALPEMKDISGYMHYYLKQIACPTCVGEQELTVTMELNLHNPVTDNYTNWIPEQGECTNNFNYTSPSTIPISLGDVLDVRSLHGLSLYESSPGSYFTTLYETEYDRDSNYNVYADDTLLFGFQSLHGFDSIEPYTLLWVDPSYAFETPIYRNGSTFWWSPNGDTQQIFNITIAVYSQDGSQLLGYISCSSSDSGQMTIPQQHLLIFPTNALTLIHLTRHKISLEPSEYFNSYIETHMEWEVIGTGHIE